MKGDAPAGSLEIGLRPKYLATIAGLPVEQDDRGIADAGEGIGDIGDAGTGEQIAVRTESHAADAAMIGAEARIVTEEDAAIHRPDFRATADMPLPQDSVQIAGYKKFAAGMEGDVVDMPLVARKFPPQRSVGDGP